MTPVPTFVVAGAARAGSTAVVEALRAHPEVFVTDPKEPHYLALGDRPAAFTGPGDETSFNRVVVTSRDAYLELYRPADGQTAQGEGSVSTLYYHQESARRLRALNPDARIVLVLREPVARAFSSHQYLRNRGLEPEADFLAAVEAEQQRISAGWHHLWHYTSMSRYADGVRHLREVFGPEQVGIWWYDDLSSDPARTLTEIQSFVGVHPQLGESVTGNRVNSSGRPRSESLQRAMQAVSSTPALRTAVRAAVPFAVRERIRRGNLRSNEVSAEVRKVLAPQFLGDLEQLETVTARTVPDSWRTA